MDDRNAEIAHTESMTGMPNASRLQAAVTLAASTEAAPADEMLEPEASATSGSPASTVTKQPTRSASGVFGRIRLVKWISTHRRHTAAAIITLMMVGTLVDDRNDGNSQTPDAIELEADMLGVEAMMSDFSLPESASGSSELSGTSENPENAGTAVAKGPSGESGNSLQIPTSAEGGYEAQSDNSAADDAPLFGQQVNTIRTVSKVRFRGGIQPAK